jgi:erythromycin esterase
MATPVRRRYQADRDADEFVRELEPFSTPLHGWEDLDPLMDRVGEARFVLLGEASHGTAEYYDWRRMISQRLIREKDFSFIAVEGDWPDCYRINRYVKQSPNAGENVHEVLGNFQRWPTWMWANVEVAKLAVWLREHNRQLPPEEKVGFYGLDVYSLWESMAAVSEYLKREHGMDLALAAREAFECFEPYGYDAEEYARSTAWSPKNCEDEVIHLLRQLRVQVSHDDDNAREAQFNAEQNALVIHNAEHYYRVMIGGDSPSWNIRDRHMVETLNRLMHFHGPAAKAIVWEHNTHIGDARYTDMAASHMINVGQLVRQQHAAADDVVLVGFSSYQGTVIAGQYWGAPMEKMTVPAAQAGSWEDILHQTSRGDRLFIFNRAEPSEKFLEPRGHRAIGVVYRPQHEAFGNYVPTVLPKRYDVLAFLDETHALHPLQFSGTFEHELPETYPSGV